MRAWITLAAVVLLSIAPSAQQALDRKKIPPPAKTPELRVPAWTKSTLANGADLIVSEKHDLPLISFSITFLGGADQFEPAGKQAVASLTAALLSEGTQTRDAESLSNALQLLGTTVNASVGSESGSISFRSTAAKFPATLAILADMLVNPTFPAAGLERLRGQRLVQLTQARAQPGAIASRVFPRIVYGIPASVRARRHRGIAQGDHPRRPRRLPQGLLPAGPCAGDRGRRHDRGSGEAGRSRRRWRAWAKGGEKPAFTFPPVAEPKATTIFLVDKPGAAQSTFAIGRPGPPRNTPDYYALQVMNTILGGMFQSRLNANIREEKGYSYGVSSSFGYGKGPGPFRTGGDIVTEKSDAALVEFMKELKGIVGSRPITDEELSVAKDALVQRLPATFASVSSINNALTTLWTQQLPDDYYQQYAKKIAAITRDDVLRVAKQYVTVDHARDRHRRRQVGDRRAAQGGRTSRRSCYYDIEGNPVK